MQEYELDITQNTGSGQVEEITNSDGEIEVMLPAGASLGWGFYKSSETEFLSSRLDGAPHIHILDDIRVADSGTDTGTVMMPEAYKFDARAVFAGKPGGVKNAIPRFGSLRNRIYYASGYSYTTTNANGYMKINEADFTGVEMAGRTKLWMYAPAYEPYKEQDKKDYAPYEKVDITELDVTEDVSIEVDISRKPSHSGKGK